MHPILFSVFGKEIYSYGIMAALGFLVGILTWLWLGRRESRPPGFAADLGFWLMAGGIVGSRLAYVVANWSYYRAAGADAYLTKPLDIDVLSELLQRPLR